MEEIPLGPDPVGDDVRGKMGHPSRADMLGLGAEARMNRPSIARGNWEWRLLPGQITSLVSETLQEMTETYGRG